MRTIAFINEKGGTCKTTLAVHLAAAIARFRRRRVVLIDLDSQGQAGKSLGIDVRGLPLSMAELMTGAAADPRPAVVPTRIKGLDLLPSNKRMAEFPLLAGDGPRWRTRLQKIVQELEGYDFAVFDSPPSLGIVTTNIMLAAEEIVVPVSLTYFALDGCAEILDTIGSVRGERQSGGPRLAAVVPTLYRRTRLADEILGRLRTYFPDTVTRQPLGYNVKIDEAQSFGQDIWEYAPASPGARQLKAITSEILSLGARSHAR